jgi:uncharacterized RDD family membrane protein YckC
MKCSKCGYLGFETSDRCKNCGYDFSLMAGATVTRAPEVAIRPDHAESRPGDRWVDDLDRWVGETSRTAAPNRSGSPAVASAAVAPVGAADLALPLFDPYGPDDAPLIALPTSPRPPLAVRRTPESPRLRAASRVPRVAELPLNFPEDGVDPPAPILDEISVSEAPVAAAAGHVDRLAGRRAMAAVIDHAILLAIDAAIVYFTLRIAGLTMREWAVVPPVPLVTFLLLLKFSYFSAFTAVGGQTIGKMAVGIRVVADGRRPLDGGAAIRRTLAGVLSVLTLGLGFLPALVGSDRRTLHDRLTGTRVALKSAGHL